MAAVTVSANFDLGGVVKNIGSRAAEKGASKLPKINVGGAT